MRTRAPMILDTTDAKAGRIFVYDGEGRLLRIIDPEFKTGWRCRLHKRDNCPACCGIRHYEK